MYKSMKVVKIDSPETNENEKVHYSAGTFLIFRGSSQLLVRVEMYSRAIFVLKLISLL